MSTTLNTTLSDRAIARIVASHAAMSRGDKVRNRNNLVSSAMAAVMSGNMTRATRYGSAVTAIDSARTATASGPDYTATASDMAATLEAAASMLRHGVTMADGSTVVASMPGTANMADAEKMATIRTRATRSANGTVAAFIAAHVTDTPRTVAELLNDAPIDGYRPSSGAIGACLVRVANGTEEVDGFAVADANGRRGAVAV
jgi:hypothetical protein